MKKLRRFFKKILEELKSEKVRFRKRTVLSIRDRKIPKSIEKEIRIDGTGNLYFSDMIKFSNAQVNKSLYYHSWRTILFNFFKELSLFIAFFSLLYTALVYGILVLPLWGKLLLGLAVILFLIYLYFSMILVRARALFFFTYSLVTPSFESTMTGCKKTLLDFKKQIEEEKLSNPIQTYHDQMRKLSYVINFEELKQARLDLYIQYRDLLRYDDDLECDSVLPYFNSMYDARVIRYLAILAKIDSDKFTQEAFYYFLNNYDQALTTISKEEIKRIALASLKFYTAPYQKLQEIFQNEQLQWTKFETQLFEKIFEEVEKK